MSNEKIICPECKKELPSDSDFCQYCGISIAKKNQFGVNDVESINELDNCRNDGTHQNTSFIHSARFAIAISILLCLLVYLSFLAVAFTDSRETYICYITKTGECFHDKECKYTTKSSYQTTVYEACRKFKPCNHCNPCVEKNKTTISVRNYVAPLLISSVTFIIMLFLTLYNKESKYLNTKVKKTKQI